MTIAIIAAALIVGIWIGWTARDWMHDLLVKYSELPDFPDAPEESNALYWSQVPVHQKRQLSIALAKRDKQNGEG